MNRLFCILAPLLLLASPALSQTSNAARWLVQEREADACDQSVGKMAQAGIIERDLTGDGREDLLLSDEHLRCGPRNLRPGTCGMQVCRFTIFVRQGDLLVESYQGLGGGVSADRGTPPVISFYNHGGSRGSVRWNGAAFR